MSDTTVTIAKNKTNGRRSAEASAGRSLQHAALHLCYGQMGISAVAAAARYLGDGKNSAYVVPVPARSDEREPAFS